MAGARIEVSVVFLCHDGAGRFLLARRAPAARDEPGRWDCGAGGLEFGEEFADAVAREVREEYTTEPRAVEVLAVRNVLRGEPVDSHWVAVLCLAEVDPARVAIGEPHKFDALDWFTAEALPAPLHSQLAATLELALPRLAAAVSAPPSA
jgi:8-oxo-dGTP pyrophosphatase MutT (NUDIX family)